MHDGCESSLLVFLVIDYSVVQFYSTGSYVVVVVLLSALIKHTRIFGICMEVYTPYITIYFALLVTLFLIVYLILIQVT